MSVFGGLLRQRRRVRGEWVMEHASGHVSGHVAARDIATSRRDEAMDYVTLADGNVVAVLRNNLAAAKALIAAQNVAWRRVEAGLPRGDASDSMRGGPLTAEQLLWRWATEARKA